MPVSWHSRSLRRELLGWLLLPLAAVVAFNVWTTYRNARQTADLVTDRMLLASARMIAENVRESDGIFQAPIPPAALEMFASEDRDRVIDRGVRLDSGKPGTGLGLAIVRDVAEIYGGSVALEESEDLGGLLVRLRLPAG